jgi:hypothetical protein
MPVLNEGRYAGEFVVSEGNGRISRETITVLSGQNLEAAAVLGKIAARASTRRSPRQPRTAPRSRPGSSMMPSMPPPPMRRVS